MFFPSTSLRPFAELHGPRQKQKTPAHDTLLPGEDQLHHEDAQSSVQGEGRETDIVLYVCVFNFSIIFLLFGEGRVCL